MAKKAGLLRAALVIGGTAIAAILSKKENRDLVLNEYNKAKEDPNAYKESVKQKAQGLTEQAKQEYAKAKEDPNAYKENLTSKVQEKAAPYKEKLNEKAAPYKEKFSKNGEVQVEEQKQTFDDEGGANNIHVVTDTNNDVTSK
ncbi:YtxH domain-containing protein [Macrococcus sp. DPC7161]|uniref:YtxH domain-containing protein n=1 Tax=Macrococcus sp. DPC7161 TaxID=2507060 RepID=UPI00100BE0FF|nr:YtxH domain-containing protein [Macrococcus sp. DPC7161]RXK18292.1 YtxH domain-containing protein [Macrococcus sp. DPC7161]